MISKGKSLDRQHGHHLGTLVGGAKSQTLPQTQGIRTLSVGPTIRTLTALQGIQMHAQI